MLAAILPKTEIMNVHISETRDRNGTKLLLQVQISGLNLQWKFQSNPVGSSLG